MYKLTLKGFLTGLAFLPAIAMAAGAANDVGRPVSSSPALAAYSFAGAIGSATQLGRIFRDGVASACGSPKPYPGIFSASTTFNYSTHTLYNNGGAQCVTVNFDPNTGASACGTNGHVSAYLNSYDPLNQNVNFLADVGSSVTQPFSFDVPAGARVILVVSNTSAAANCTYAFSAPALSDSNTPATVPALDGKLLLAAMALLLVSGAALWRKRS